jgi:hypothetical protein
MVKTLRPAPLSIISGSATTDTDASHCLRSRRQPPSPSSAPQAAATSGVPDPAAGVQDLPLGAAAAPCVAASEVEDGEHHLKACTGCQHRRTPAAPSIRPGEVLTVVEVYREPSTFLP